MEEISKNRSTTVNKAGAGTRTGEEKMVGDHLERPDAQGLTKRAIEQG